MNNEILNIENVEIDLETLADATSQLGGNARWRVVEAVIKALDPEDARKLEEYINQ